MPDPVPQTGGWLRLVVQGYFTYYAVPGNLESLAVFGIGCWDSGGAPFAAGANSVTSRGLVCLR